MTEDPGDAPYTKPDAGSTVATELTLLLQVPPEVPLLKGDAEPRHTFELPVIVVGRALTVTFRTALQPVDKV